MNGAPGWSNARPGSIVDPPTRSEAEHNRDRRSGATGSTSPGAHRARTRMSLHQITEAFVLQVYGLEAWKPWLFPPQAKRDEGRENLERILAPLRPGVVSPPACSGYSRPFLRLKAAPVGVVRWVERVTSRRYYGPRGFFWFARLESGERNIARLSARNIPGGG